MIPHNRPTIGLEEQKAAIRVLESGNLSNGIASIHSGWKI